MVEDAGLESFEIDGDVGKFGHGGGENGKRLRKYAELSYNKGAGRGAKALQGNWLGVERHTSNCGEAGEKASELAAGTGEKNS